MLLFSIKLTVVCVNTPSIKHSLHDFFFVYASYRTICLKFFFVNATRMLFLMNRKKILSFGSQIAAGKKLNRTAGFEWIHLHNMEARRYFGVCDNISFIIQTQSEIPFARGYIKKRRNGRKNKDHY